MQRDATGALLDHRPEPSSFILPTSSVLASDRGLSSSVHD